MTLEDEVREFMDADGWIRGSQGEKIDVLDLRPEMIRIQSIALGLARESRFRGQANEFLSVAQHSLRVSYLAEELSGDAAEAWGDPEEYLRQIALYGLLHDAAEYGLGDMARPVKRLPAMSQFRDLDRRWQDRIYNTFGLLSEEPEVIKEADTMVCLLEVKRHMLRIDWSETDRLRARWCKWHETEGVDDPDANAFDFGEYGSRRFLKRFAELSL